jgi:tetratricopeptide (TPR) repeat protein
MVAFGSARSAVDCAVAVQRALAQHNHENSADQVHVRMGMNTGEAIREEGDLFGSAVDAASRIMSKAAGGQILVSESVRSVIGSPPDINLIDRGPFWLKGFPERWRLHEVIWHEDRISTAAVLPHIGQRTPFVGRESERADLRRYLEAARGGHGSLVMIGGEPGVGKTRITEELVAEARRHGFLTLTGHCYEMEGAPPYIPFVEIIESVVHIIKPEVLLNTLGDSAPELAKLMPELRRHFPDIPTPQQLPPEQERRRMFNGVLDFIARVAHTQPLLLVLEDLHWADESTMLLLQHIVQRLQEIPALTVGTYRDTELDVARSLAKTLEELLRRRLAHDLILRRLPEADVAAMLQKHSEQKPPRRLVELIYRETEGIPFFVEEIYKHFAEEGKLFDAKGGWRLDLEIDEAEVPRGIRLVVGRRLERVSEECRSTLTSAAIIGRGFSFDLLEELANLDEDTLFYAIEEAEQAQLITSKTEGGKARFIFAHELIRQTLVGTLSLPRRQRAHLRAAETLEQLHSDALEENVADLAYHFYQGGGDPEKIITYSVMAAERATAQTAHEEAIAQYQRALQTLEMHKPVDEFHRCQLLLALGHARSNAGDTLSAQETFLEVTEIARRLPAPEQFAEAVLGYCSFWHVAGFIDPQLLDLIDEGLTLLPDRDSALRAALTGRLASLLEQTGDERRVGLSEQALDMARRVGDAKALYYGLFSRAYIWGTSLKKRISFAAELTRLEEEIGSPEGGDWGLCLLCHLHWVKGDIAAVRADLAALKDRVGLTSYTFTQWAIKTIETTYILMEGRLEEAEKKAAEAFALGQKYEEMNASQILAAVIYTIRWLQGRPAEIDETFRGFLVQQPFIKDIPLIRAMLTHIHLMVGRKEEAQKELTSLAANKFAIIPKDWSMTTSLMHLSEVATGLGDKSRAIQLYDLLRPYDGQIFISGLYTYCLGAVSHWLGMLAATFRRWREAATHFEHAIQTNARIGARPFLARSQHEYARMLIERNESGDKEKARTLLDEAIPIYRELGMPTFLKDAEELMGNL